MSAAAPVTAQPTLNEHTATGGVSLEIVVQDAVGARAALAAGADRLELCADLRAGGLTPSIGIVETVLEAVAGGRGSVHALVRSRPGGFVYGEDEVDSMCRDIRAFKAAGMHGVVVGALSPQREIDLFALERWVQAAGSMSVTFHRALDACTDPLGQLKRLAGTGVGRVLTSGGAVRTAEGLHMLETMVQDGPAGIEVMAGGGVQLSDIPELVRIGVNAVHLSARIARSDFHPAGPGAAMQDFDVTSADLVARAHQEIARARGVAFTRNNLPG